MSEVISDKSLMVYQAMGVAVAAMVISQHDELMNRHNQTLNQQWKDSKPNMAECVLPDSMSTAYDTVFSVIKYLNDHFKKIIIG